MDRWIRKYGYCNNHVCVINDDDTIYNPVYVFRDVNRVDLFGSNDIRAELLREQIIWNSDRFNYLIIHKSDI